ncbi:hypothetical protein DPMN_173354 [Dreissena polymorpha]|uniref:Uncharacterized protein n=1 Tax=Dreissena polymorpha TaxID=45954 RepID=A0A9D4IHH9_DREPO|nr:hypothetical protein DPMN_173354 [Dreissena polymorpha]
MHTKITNCPHYTADPTLRNIVNGIVAESDVNVHAFQKVGNNIMRDIKGKSDFDYKFKRKDRAKTLGNSFAVKSLKILTSC